MKTVRSDQDVTNQLQSLLSELSAFDKRELLNRSIDKAESELSEKQSALLKKINKEHVVLNVGGKLFPTSAQTLTSVPNSKLDKLLKGRTTIRTDENGYLFLDRNPDYFCYVLEYLRDGRVIFPSDSFMKERIIKELKYFECLSS